jgi:hypothetical protein
MKLTETTDAMVWATEFCRIFKGFVIFPVEANVGGNTVDEGTMVGWFANAMQTALDLDGPQVVTAHVRDDDTIELLDLEPGRDVRISPELLVELVNRINQGVRGRPRGMDGSRLTTAADTIDELAAEVDQFTDTASDAAATVADKMRSVATDLRTAGAALDEESAAAETAPEGEGEAEPV